MISPNVRVERGEIWEVRFDPSEGDEIKKVRPAVVLSIRSAGRMQLRIVVPITSWQPQFVNYFWMVRLAPTSTSGLTKESAPMPFS
jgi:mRNA interferase MazF